MQSRPAGYKTAALLLSYPGILLTFDVSIIIPKLKVKRELALGLTYGIAPHRELGSNFLKKPGGWAAPNHHGAGTPPSLY